MRHDDDVLWKGITEEVCDDLLRFIFPGVDQVLDLERGFSFLDKELAEMYPEPEKPSSTRFADKLVKVFTRDGQEEWILIHIEVQGETKAVDRPLFPARMFRYYYRIYDRYQKPMTAIALFTGPDGQKMTDKYEYRFLGTSHIYQYNTYRITDPTEEELTRSDNPFALVVLAAKTALLEGKIPELELKDRKLLVAKYLLSNKHIPKEKIDKILTFLNNIVLFENQETNLIFMEQLDQLTGKKNSMGIIERLAERRAERALEQGLEQGLERGREEGREEGAREAQQKSIKSLLDNTEFSAEKIASLIGVPVSFVERVKESLSAK